MAHFTTYLALFTGALLASYFVAHRLRLPVIPVYILAGIGVSLFVHAGETKVFEALGVILLLFYIGLEFSLAEMEKNFKNILSVGIVDLTLNLFPLWAVSAALGFDPFTAFVLAVILYPSSSAIVSKLLIDLKKLANPEVEPVLAILVFEDIAAATLLAVLVNISTTGSADPVTVLKVVIKIALFIFFAVVFIKNFNKVVDVVIGKYGTATEFLVLLVGTVLFAFVEVAMGFGLSEAIGAFAAGTLFAETSHKESVEQVVIPYRDLFGALFFLTFGISIDLSKMEASLIVPLGVLIVASFATKLLTGVAAGKLYGLSLKRGVSAGLMLLPRGEFSILVAATVPKLVPITAVYVLASSILGSFAVKESGKILNLLFRKKKKRKSRLSKSQLLGD
ncbi:cation:proton antiporter [Thermovibrio ammonificans]